MRKILNRYSISVIVIVIVACGVLVWVNPTLLNTLNTAFEGEGGVGLMLFIFVALILLFAIFILISLLMILSRVLTRPSKIGANVEDTNTQEESRGAESKRTRVALIAGVIGIIITIPPVILFQGGWDSTIIVIASLFMAPTFAIFGVILMRHFEGVSRDVMRKRTIVAIISGAIGALITIVPINYLHFSTGHSPWYETRPSEYISIVEFPSTNTVIVTNPSGDVFHIFFFRLSCRDDDCLKEGDLQDDPNLVNILSEGAREKNNLCYPIIPPPKPPVKMESGETVFRDCNVINMGEKRYFIDGNGYIYWWGVNYQDVYFSFLTIGAFTIPIFGILGVAFYRRLENTQ
jgi:hypothetical protein